jgi:hypothetical protein
MLGSSRLVTRFETFAERLGQELQFLSRRSLRIAQADAKCESLPRVLRSAFVMR